MKEINIQTVRDLANNDSLKESAAMYLIRKAEFETLKPIVEGVYNDVLKKYSFKSSLKAQERGRSENITNYKYLYLTDDNTDQYYQEADDALFNKGLKRGIKKGYCPLCCKEMEMINLENEIMKHIQEAFDIPDVWDMKIRKEMIDLTVGLLIGKDQEAV